MEDLFCQLVTEQRPSLQTRMSRADIPLTIPGIMKDYPAHTQEIAENSRIQRWDEAAVMKILSAVVPQKKFNKIFAPLVEDPLLGGHFLVLKAYILGLEETPPLPDHYMYRMHDTNLKKSRSNLEYLKISSLNPLQCALLRAQEEKILRTSIPLLMGPLQPLEELEKRAKAKVEAFYQSHHVEPAAKASGGKKKKKKKTSSQPLLEETKMIPENEDLLPNEENIFSDSLRISSAIGPSTEIFHSTASPDGSETLSSSTLSPAETTEQLSSEESGSASPTDTQQLTEEEGDEDTNLLATQPKALEDADERAAAGASYPSEPWKAYPQKKSPPLGPVALQPESIHQVEATIPMTLKPKIHALWETFSAEPSMEWSDFQTMITKIGFGIEPNGGSIRRILYPEIRSTTGRRHLIVHEPHGAFTTLGPDTLSYLRSALSEDFGWSRRSFVTR